MPLSDCRLALLPQPRYPRSRALARGGGKVGDYVNSDRIRDTSPEGVYVKSQVKVGWAHLTSETLYHSLPFRLCIVRSSTAAEFTPEVLAIDIFVVRGFRLLMKRTRMCQGTGRAVAAKMAFWKQLKLFVIGMTGDGAGRADAAL